MPAPLTIGTSRALLGGVSALSAFRALLLANAQRAWWGPDASLSAWPCAVTGLNAAPGGSGTTLGTLSGVPCPVLNGAGRFATSAAAISGAQPYAVVCIASCNNVAASRAPFGLGTAASDVIMRWTITSQRLRMAAGANLESAPADTLAVATPIVLRGVFNGASSAGYRNEALIASGNAGANALSTAMIGNSNDLGQPFIGSIALLSIFSGTDYAARAATVAAAARALIGV